MQYTVRRQHSGHTLLELMVALAAAAILLAIAVPSFSSMLKRNRVMTQQDTLYTTLMLARSEAIKRAQSVSICASADGENCLGNSQWQQGYLVYKNTDGTGLFNANTDEIIRIVDGLNGGNTLKYGTSSYLTFNDRGNAPGHNGTFSLCDQSNDENYARIIAISITGRPRRSSGDNSTC